MFLQRAARTVRGKSLGSALFLLALLVSAVLVGALFLRSPEPAQPAAPAAATAPGTAPETTPQAASIPAPAAAEATAPVDSAGVQVGYGVVKFYFESGSSELAPGAMDALASVLQAARAGRQVLIAGFHDPQGDAVHNRALAMRRARAVGNALLAAGVPAARIGYEEPSAAAVGSADAEARRVEIRLQ